MSFQPQPKGFATAAIHAGQDPEQWAHRSVVPPLVTSTTYQQTGPGEYEQFAYSRTDNPTRNVLERCLARLDGAKHGLAFASGMGAATAIMQLLSSGDHVLCSDDIYGGTNELLLEVFSRYGMHIDVISMMDVKQFERAIRPNTKLVWLETPTNPLLQVIDLEALSKAAHKHPDIIVVVDNTFLTPYLQRPLDLGADIVMYSMSKYINGHTDVVMGSVITSNDGIHSRLRFLQNASGGIPSPFDCYQVNRSLKTLALRMTAHGAASLVIARHLEAHPLVEKVMHPGLPSHPQHALALRQMYGHSGMISFYIKGGLEQARKLVMSVQLIILAASLGGVESTIQLPVKSSHLNISVEQRTRLGITDNLIRLSVGLEDVDDLIEDLDRALELSQA